jgi:hypothetical protein
MTVLLGVFASLLLRPGQTSPDGCSAASVQSEVSHLTAQNDAFKSQTEALRSAGYHEVLRPALVDIQRRLIEQQTSCTLVLARPLPRFFPHVSGHCEGKSK